MQRGWGKLLALHHLIVWIPLLTFVLVRFADADLSSTEFYHGDALLVINGISIGFDISQTRGAGLKAKRRLREAGHSSHMPNKKC